MSHKIIDELIIYGSHSAPYIYKIGEDNIIEMRQYDPVHFSIERKINENEFTVEYMQVRAPHLIIERMRLDAEEYRQHQIEEDENLF
jgi:hypothetical protein